MSIDGELPELLGVEDVARIFRVPKSWVYGHLDDLPTVRLGRYVRFRRSEIERFLSSNGVAIDER